MVSKLAFGCYQHQGARKNQEDYFATTEPTSEVVRSHAGFLAVVADGMGGHSDGALASLTAVNTFMQEYGEKGREEKVPDALQRSLLKANQALLAVSRNRGNDSDMGTTLLATVLRGTQLYWISVGDSRLYRLRRGILEATNEDHSYGAELDARLMSGQITTAEAESQSNKRHMLTSYMGIERIPKIHLSRVPLDLQVGDQILLCTDGLTNTLDDSEITFCLNSKSSAQDKCEELGRRVAEKNKPHQDNVTIVLFEVTVLDKTGAEASLRFAKGGKKLGMIALGAALMVAMAAGGFVWWKSSLPTGSTKQKTSASAKHEVIQSPSTPKAEPTKQSTVVAKGATASGKTDANALSGKSAPTHSNPTDASAPKVEEVRPDSMDKAPAKDVGTESSNDTDQSAPADDQSRDALGAPTSSNAQNTSPVTGTNPEPRNESPQQITSSYEQNGSAQPQPENSPASDTGQGQTPNAVFSGQPGEVSTNISTSTSAVDDSQTSRRSDEAQGTGTAVQTPSESGDAASNTTSQTGGSSERTPKEAGEKAQKTQEKDVQPEETAQPAQPDENFNGGDV